VRRRRTQRGYAGRGVAKIAVTSGNAIPMMPPEYATILPEPLRIHDEIRERYISVNGAIDATAKRPQPRLTVRDAKVIANNLTLALRNDLPSIDPHDAAVIWEQWRRSVAQLRDMMSGLDDDEQALAIGVNLDQWTRAIHGEMAEAVRRPGKVFARYCPWRDEWATDERIRPGAVR